MDAGQRSLVVADAGHPSQAGAGRAKGVVRPAARGALHLVGGALGHRAQVEDGRHALGVGQFPGQRVPARSADRLDVAGPRQIVGPRAAGGVTGRHDHRVRGTLHHLVVGDRGPLQRRADAAGVAGGQRAVDAHGALGRAHIGPWPGGHQNPLARDQLDQSPSVVAGRRVASA